MLNSQAGVLLRNHDLHVCALKCCEYNKHNNVPVVAVDVVQPAALLDDLYGPGDVLPRGEAVPPLVFLAIAGLDAAAVGALFLPAGVVVGALLRLRASQDGTWRRRWKTLFSLF